MVVTETIEGLIDSVWWYHYDIGNDVLYLRLVSHLKTETAAEETPDGFLLLRSSDTRAVGLTIINWWKRFGVGTRPDSMSELARQIEPWAKKVAA